MTIRERVEKLLAYADPEGSNYERLNRILDRTTGKVGPSMADLNFLAEMDYKIDNVECVNLARDGLCLVRGRDCEYLHERFDMCRLYDDPRK